MPRSQGHQAKEIGTTLKKSRSKWYLIGFCLTSLTMVSCFWFFSLREAKNLKAQDAIFQATYYFEAGDFDKALKGNADHRGFLDVIKAYPYTTTANLACFYAGVAYMHQKEYDQALFFLKKFKAKDFILQARAWCVMGDAYSEQKKHKEAAIYYMKAAHYKANSVYTPGYLVKAAIAFEADAQYKNAYRCYQEIIAQYPTSRHGSSLAIKEASRLSGLC
ncbi:MAG: tetratricopeptide repeat protein [Candidatus Cardinium sp.]|uniref:tetratricopeptide repeat protein n=1 Tax=Candidatus Cardinium sp. TP TaxID=2961955 RepID=UPI0021AE9AC1|nr:tetratricopeptide repeat protein [Candidatus Cardinium sp. TP]MCT4696924.1 cytochrome C biosynthesis protein [Candidatus Cardinium sp. TP]MDN5246868.1 cytochrome C biosynthesis protein [Candidatus Cardinium sp.]